MSLWYETVNTIKVIIDIVEKKMKNKEVKTKTKLRPKMEEEQFILHAEKYISILVAISE